MLGQGGRKRGRPVNVERNPITGVLDGETANWIRSLVPTVVDDTLKVLQNKTQEMKNRKRFLMAVPPVFSGGLDPVVVRNWIMEMENTFEICMCSDDRKVLYASFMLKGQALFWWNEKKERLGKEVMETMTWDEFKKMVYDEYSPSTLMARLEQEYTLLKQEKMTVQEYATKFIEKARFAPDNVTTKRKINWFFCGLNKDIKILLNKKKGPSLDRVEALNEFVELALETEDELAKSDKDKQASTSGN